MASSLASRAAAMVHLPHNAKSPCLNTADALLGSLLSHHYCPISHDLFPTDRLLLLTELGKRLFYDIIPQLEDTQREQLRTSHAFRGLYQFFPLTGKGGKPTPIDCFSFGKETNDPVALRSAYYANNGFEVEEYIHKINRKNPTHALATLKPAGEECVTELVAAFEDLQAVSMDVLQHVAAAMGIKPSTDCVRPSPDASVDERYFSPFHSRQDSNLVFKLHRAIVERNALVDVSIREGQKQGSALTAPRVLRRKTAVADLTSPPKEVVASSSPLPTQQTDTASSALPPVPEKDASTISLLVPDVTGLRSYWRERNAGGAAAGARALECIPTPFEIYSEDSQSFEPMVLPMGSSSSKVFPIVPLAVTSGLFLERWTDGLVPATRYRQRLHGDTHNRAFYESTKTNPLVGFASADAFTSSATTPTSSSAGSASTVTAAAAAAAAAAAGAAAAVAVSSQHVLRPTASDRCNITFLCTPNLDATVDPFTASDEYDPNNRGGAPFVVGDEMPQ